MVSLNRGSAICSFLFHFNGNDSEITDLQCNRETLSNPIALRYFRIVFYITLTP